MNRKYILGVDQSTQGTKAMLFDGAGRLVAGSSLPHAQLVNGQGWIEHDPEEIFRNTVQAVEELLNKTTVEKRDIIGVGICNQRETSIGWSRSTGKPVANAIVWQCSRAKDICSEIEAEGFAPLIGERTGLTLSPYFPASKFAWLMQNTPGIRQLADGGDLCLGTVDSWLLYRLTRDRRFCTDYSNASRTMLFDLHDLEWNREICSIFGIPEDALPQVCFSDSLFGETDFQGLLPAPVPIHAMMGDSHSALFGQGCLRPGMAKATYGTGSSVMMNIGDTPLINYDGIATSIAWGMDHSVSYVLEGNINYTGAVIRWLQEIGLIGEASEVGPLCQEASADDKTYFVPAFTGLGAPYWDSKATGIFTGIIRSTGRAEMVKAGEESIAYQIADIVEVMQGSLEDEIPELRVDGGATRDRYLMQFQSDILGIPLSVPDLKELSVFGAVVCAGIALGLYTKDTLQTAIDRTRFHNQMKAADRKQKREGWKRAVTMARFQQDSLSCEDCGFVG